MGYSLKVKTLNWSGRLLISVNSFYTEFTFSPQAQQTFEIIMYSRTVYVLKDRQILLYLETQFVVEWLMSSRSCNYTSLDVTQGVQVVMPEEVAIFLLSSVHTRACFPRWSTGSLYSYSLTASITWTDCNRWNLNSYFSPAKQNTWAAIPA